MNPFRCLAAASLLAGAQPGCARLQLGTRAHSEMNENAAAWSPDLVEYRWSAPLVGQMELETNPRNRAVPLVDRAHGVVYVGGLDRGLHALRADDGVSIWRFQTLGVVEGTPVLRDGTLYFGSDDGALYAIDAATGAQRWRFATTAEVVRAPVVTADTVYVVNGDDSVFALDRARGTQRWRYHREPPGGITASGHAGLLFARNRLYSGFSDGVVVALDPADGSALWERDTSSDAEEGEVNEAHRVIDVDTTPLLLDGTLFIASQSQGLYALDPEGGGVRWRLDWLTSATSIDTDGRHLFATSSTLGLLEIDPSDGTVGWARDFNAGGLQVASVGDGMLLVSSASQALWVVRARDGEALQGVARGGVSGLAVRSGAWIYFATSMGVIEAYALRRDDAAGHE